MRLYFFIDLRNGVLKYRICEGRFENFTKSAELNMKKGLTEWVNPLIFLRLPGVYKDAAGESRYWLALPPGIFFILKSLWHSMQ